MAHLGEKDFYDRDVVLKAQRERIQRGLFGGLPEDEIMKGGEGSRGGKVIGHTKSGKPIYDSASHEKHKDFSKQDHLDASKVHSDKRDKNEIFGTVTPKNFHKKEKQNYHNQQSKEHREASEKVESEKGHKIDDKIMFHPHGTKSEPGYAKHEGTITHDYGDGNYDVKDSKDFITKYHKDKLTKVEKASDTETKELIDEHKKLVNVLESPSHEDDAEEAKKQKKELKGYEKKVEKAMTAAAGEGVTQKESVEHNPKDMQNSKPSDLKKAFEILGVE